MTISTTTSRASYNGNGVTTTFSVPFRFFQNGDLVVQLVTVSTGASTTLTLTTHYTVSGADSEAGGSVTMLTPPAVGQRLVIRRVIAATQEVDYVSGDPFPAETHERALDRLTMLAQQGEEVNARALVFPAGDTASGEIPAVSARAGKVLGFNGSGELTVTAPASGSAAELALDLASTASGNGGFLVRWIQSGIGAVARWVSEKLRERVSPEDFGAVGDGVTNDAPAFNAAINHLALMGGGVLVATPGKTYAIAASSVSSGVVMKTGVYLHLHGAKLKAIGVNSPNYRLLWIQQVSNCGVRGGEIEGDKLTNSSVADAQGHGVYIILDCVNVTVEGVTIKNCFGDGVYSGRLCSNIRILNNTITNNRRNNVSVVSSSNVLIHGNDISNANGQAPEAGIDVEPNPGDATSYNVTITNNRIYGNAQQGIDFPAPPPTPLIENAIVANNHIYNNGGAGIKASYVKHITIDANHIYGNAGGGIVDSAALATSMVIQGNTIYNNTGTAIDGFISNAKVTGNVISNHSGWGIRWKFGQHVTIADNNILDCGEDGILYERAYNSTISGNVIKNTQKHGIWITGTGASSVTRSRKVTIGNNTVAFAGLLTDNTYSGIYLDSFTNTSVVNGNTVVAGTSGNLPLHAIHAVDSTVFAANNHTSGGAKSGNAQINVGGVALPSFLNSPNVLSETYAPRYYVPGIAFISGGAGSPEGVLGAPVGSLYLRSDGGAGTSLYVKQTGSSNTGWVGK